MEVSIPLPNLFFSHPIAVSHYKGPHIHADIPTHTTKFFPIVPTNSHPLGLEDRPMKACTIYKPSQQAWDSLSREFQFPSTHIVI